MSEALGLRLALGPADGLLIVQDLATGTRPLRAHELDAALRAVEDEARRLREERERPRGLIGSP